MLKKLLAGATAAAVLGVGGVAVAGAVSSPSSTSTSSTAPKANAHAPKQGAGRLLGLAVKTAADKIGIDTKTLRAGVQSGKTIAQIASAHHVAPAAVVSAIVTKVDTAINAAVKAGKLDASKAAKAKQRVPSMADRLVNHTTSLMPHLRHGPKQKFHSRATLTAAAKAIGISSDTLRTAMRSGQSIASVATAHGVARTKVVAAMVAVADRNFDATAKTHHVDTSYRKRIPAIIGHIVDGTVSAHRRAMGHHAKTKTTATIGA